MSRAAPRPAGTLELPCLLLTALMALGCGVQPWTPPAPTDLEDVPLDVWLPSGPDVAATPYTVFHVNKPAYVAIFDIHPGEGVHAIYPRGPASGQRLISAGYGMTSITHGTAACHPLGVSPVVYRFIVASTEPLNVEELRGDVSFRHFPGVRTRFFAAGSPVRTMEAIVERTLPGPPSALDAGDWAAYYTPYWVPPCAPRILTRLARAVISESDQGETDGTGEGSDRSDREEAGEIPGISPPELPVDVRVRPPATEENTVVTAGRLGEAPGVSERIRTPVRVDPGSVGHGQRRPASVDARRAGHRRDLRSEMRKTRPRVQRPDRVRTPRVERPKRVRSGASARPKKPSKPSKPKKDGAGAS